MKYDLKCKVTPKQEYKTRLKHDTINICVFIYHSKTFTYGNGKGLVIRIGDDTPDYVDIRYDIRYKENNELDFVQAFVKEYAHVNLIFDIEKISEVKIYE